MRKDLRIEIRSGQSTIALFALSLLIMVVLVFALNPQPADRARDAAAALWVALVFAGMLGATRAMIAENENGCIRALTLSPIDPAALYAAKLAAAFAFMAIVEVAAVVLITLFFNLDFSADLARLAPSLMLGTLGLRGARDAAGCDFRPHPRGRSAAADSRDSAVHPRDHRRA